MFSISNAKPIYRSYKWDKGAGLEIGKRTLVMGILNATPDSFSDGGRYLAVEEAVKHACQMVQAGADLLDIGGESTRPGAAFVSAEEEISRIIPVVVALREELPHIPLSIDTYKAETARAALKAGAHIINDIWGLKHDPDMAKAAAQYNCPIIISHNRKERNYNALMPDLLADLQESVDLARQAGIEENNIWLDPGIGFAKTYEDNLEVMRHLYKIVELGYPVLLGTSRKRFIQNTLALPASEVVEGTCATVVLGAAQGCQLVRVHDVGAVKRAVTMTDAMLYGTVKP
ncbi:dihydropteroate synthase [Paenibacillus sp. IITD108]|uniref:dihydropteroate synthase n=1 Tax=Paenibacillus sp. IITD108 TaxID=3116649 RepID=UPI002F404606